jgi:hypothetical protein
MVYGIYQTTVTPYKHTCTPSIDWETRILKQITMHTTLIKSSTSNKAFSNAYLATSYIPFRTKCIIMKYRTGTL